MKPINTHQLKNIKVNSFFELKSILLLLSFFILQGASNVFAQITLTNPNVTPAYAVTDVLLGQGVVATNITFNGSPFLINNPQNSVREFSNTSAAFPLSGGVLMQTNGGSVVTDADLSAITPNNVTNGAILEFDFVPDGDTLSFSYIFTSAEYSSFTCSNFNDVFGFFISGPGITGPYSNNSQNIAIVPGSNNIPVGINTVNSGSASGGSGTNCSNIDPNWVANSVYFTTIYNSIYNNSPAITTAPNYNGSTVELTANASVICGEVYHIKLAISNVSDQSYNSAVFLKAGSFASEPNIVISSNNVTSNYLDTVIVEGCDVGSFCFERTLVQSLDTSIVYYELSGLAIRALDYTFTNLPNSGDSIVLPPGVTNFCLNFNPTDDGFYEGPQDIFLTAYTINSCGDSTFSYADIWIVDKPLDLITDAGADTTVCSGGTGTLNGTFTIPTNQIKWTYTGPGNVVFTPDDETINAGVAFDTPGQYEFFLTEKNDSCALLKVDSMIVIYEELTFNVSSDTTICENGEATLFANATGATNFEYHWGHTTDLSANQSIMPASQTNLTVFARSDSGCVTPTETIVVDVLPPLGLSSTASQTICPGESINVTSTVSGGNGGPYNYTWTDPTGAIVGTSNIINVSPAVTTIYTVFVSDDCESTPKVSTSEVVVVELPAVKFGVVDGEICTPAEFVIFNQTDPLLVQDTYWYISDDQVFMQNDTINVLITEAGVYGVRMVIVTPDGCVDSLSINEMLTVYPKPKADFTYYPKPATILNAEVNFQNYSEDADTYYWSFEGGNPIFSTLEDPKTQYPEGVAATYEVELISTSMFNCKDTITKIVAVIPEVLIFAPNSFTPDGDELNPTWKPVIEGIDKMNVTLEVYNRWGEKVWESHNLDVGWDGTYGQGGSLVKVGTYVWKIQATNLINDDKYVWDGVLTVIY
jgi:gliding motility-associated-like protein